MEVLRNRSGIFVSQRKYILDLLAETSLLESRLAETPMDLSNKLRKCPDRAPIDKGRYQSFVERLIYLSHTRPNITFVVSTVSQFMHSPREALLDVAYQILKYLKRTASRGLFFKKNSKGGIEAFIDADWVGSIKNRKSTSRYSTFVWRNLVT
ncbi:hypothetical protein PanWU01x14_323300 [Parasponia andersonii]|uniref:Uncharacterized protein n=1 Tax=Parasponia andersonii TaxID=3476 RepID=A0A2P5AKH6_PARAD|nr:hypothetical protein PanWU01x14_323300 [Parasponia andersonii]